ncbi:MAG: hypothetical protein QNJ06_22375, partial [Kiloniellales bacterium]|nr:hypothetical protein [Kiloniellales bacterium]
MTRLLLSLFLLAALAGIAPVAAGEGPPAQPVNLRPEIKVEADVLRLGDIFDGLDARAEVTVARAPAPGRQLRLSGQWLRRLARAHNLAWQPSLAGVSALVSRASQIIGPREIVDAIARSLEREGVGGDLDVVLDNP